MSDPSVASVLLLDLDGVLRRWDPAINAEVEAEFGLSPGALLSTAFASERLEAVVTGRMTDEQWREAITDELAALVGADRARAAVLAWSYSPGEVVADVLALVRDVRASGHRVAIMTNATTRVRDDLARLDLVAELDEIFSSAELGVAKPDPRAYAAAVSRLGIAAEQIVYLDDSAANVAAVAAVGLRAHLFTTAERAYEVARESGLLEG